MEAEMRPRLTYANVMATVAVFIALGGSAYAFHLGKNSVGPKQLKKNAVTTAKVKNEAITAAKVKRGTLTGQQINVAALGTVPTAQRADLANSLPPSEGWHEVGAPGEPGFLSSWKNKGNKGTVESAAFYRDHDGIVHLKGLVGGGTEPVVFRLPPGYRPAGGKGIYFSVVCFDGNCSASGNGSAVVYGSGLATPEFDGAVEVPTGASTVSFNGIDFRAES
jgi:hypothetical protein